MKTSRFLATRAAISVVALASLGVSAGHAAAGTPPTTPPPTEPTPAADDTAPSETLPEIVESWTLTPGGGPDGEEAGSRPNLQYQVAAGTVIDDTVIVYNLGNVPMNFAVYATDAFNNDDGEFDLLPGNAPPVDAGSWVTLAQEAITLPPGKQAVIPITITVPVDATPGDHVGAIVASSVTTSDNGDGQVVNVDRRTGTRLYVQVEGPLNPELAVTDLQTTYHHALNSLSGSAEVSFRVENRGNVRLRGTPSVEIGGLFGLGAEKITLPELTELLPGQDVEVTATLEGVPALFVDFTTVRVEPVDAADLDASVAIGKDRTFAPPITLLMVGILLLLGWMTWRRYRRHRDADTTAEQLPSARERTPELDAQLR
jgi:Bacterial protein of unknown function (DUF916)